MPDPLRVAVIGAGQIALRGHLPGYVKAGASIVALCDTRAAHLAQISAQYHIERQYTDWRNMLDDGGFDAVSICAPPVLHAEMAVECLRRGLPTLVEKPMALSLDECDAMIAAAAESNALLTVAHNQRYVAHHRRAKQILDSGMLGKPYLAHAVFGHAGPEYWSPEQTWYFRADLAGPGALADLGSHKIDLLTWLLDQTPVEVAAMGATFEKATTASDAAMCLLRFDGGTLASLNANWVTRPGWDNSLTIQCERGILQVPTEMADPVRALAASGETTLYEAEPDDPSGWFGMVAAFARAVTEGGPSPISGAEGRRVMRTVFAAQAALTGKTVVTIDHQ